MKFTKLDLLTLLISLFLFASCNKSNTIGLDLDPANAIQGNLVDTITVGSKTVGDSPVNTYGTSPSPTRYPLGSLTDNILGSTQASLVLGVNLPSAAYTFGTNPVIDSAVLVLTYSAPGTSTLVGNTTYFYGDTTSTNYTVKVHQLTNNLYLESSFLSNRQWAFNANSDLGTYTGKIKPTTPFKITDIVVGKADTLKAALPQLRIKLNNSFAQTNIANLSAAQLLNNPSFYAAFKGLYVTASASGGTGGIMMINAADSRIEVYYKRQNATTTTAIDTVSVNFPISPSTGPVAANVTNQFSTAVQTQLADASKTQYDVTYLQPMGGLRTKINFPYLSSFTKTVGGRVVVNKAELVISLSSGTDAAPLTPSQRLALYKLDIAGQRTIIQDYTPATAVDPRSVANFGGTYDATNKQYKFIVTSYLQDLLDGKTVDYGTYLSASDFATFDYTPSVNSAARSVIGSFKNSTNKIKLNVYYTKIN